MEIETVEKGLVAPSDPTPSEDIWLSNLDHLVAKAHTPTVYFYRRPLSASADFFSPPALRSALSRALVAFYPLAGRLATGVDGRMYIKCTAEGALFVVARSDSAIDDFGDFAPSDRLRRLLVPSVDSAEDADAPLVLFQITFFSCGGVCLGTAVHHSAADGLAALHFINSWAIIARDEGVVTAPILDRTLLRARSPLVVTSEHIEYSQSLAGSPARPTFTTSIIKLSKKQLSLLKTPSLGEKPLSTFKAVAAHIWRCACKARGLDVSRPTRFYFTVDARTRLHPSLPANFLGNAIFVTSAISSVGEVVSGPIELAAGKIDAATARLDDGYVRSLVDYLDQRVGEVGLRKGSWVMAETDMWLISWQGLPIHEADFGWGKLFYMGRASLHFAGQVYVVPRSPVEEGDGGLLLALAMEPENMQRFKEVFDEELRLIASAHLWRKCLLSSSSSSTVRFVCCCKLLLSPMLLSRTSNNYFEVL